MVLDGQVQSQLLELHHLVFIKSFMKASSLARTRHAHQVTAVQYCLFCSSMSSLHVQFEPDHAVSSEQWQTQMETEQSQFNTGLWFLISRCVY